MTPKDLEGWEKILKREWDERARSEYRDYYVASHAGWDDPAAWEERAAKDAAMAVTGIDPDVLGESRVLEIGCGVGRLAPWFSAKCASYSGFDVSPEMVAEARLRCEGLAGARFSEGAGGTVPAELSDHEYEFIFAMAVFIHCPLEIIRSLVRDACLLLAPGGIFRLQVNAVTADLTGIVDLAQAAEIHEKSEVIETSTIGRELIDDRHYKGHEFLYDDLEPALAELTAHEIGLLRLDPKSIYAEIKRES